jgi:AraC-like DNA-binding protein
MDSTFVPQTETSTDRVAPSQRLEYWESRNAAELIGLRCSTFAPEGLSATKRHFDLGSLSLCDIRGNEHVIERPRPMLRTHPKDSIFAGVLLQGEAFFYQSGRCIPVRQGDLIIYPTTQPYLYGFTGDMRQIQVDIPADGLIADGRIARPSAPMKIDSTLPAGRLLATALRGTMSEFIDNPLAANAARAAERIRSLLEALLSAQVRSRPSEESATLRLLRAEAFIAEHLHDPSLDAAEVARHLNMSVRHLNRLFAPKHCTVTHWIWSQRLLGAHDELVGGAARSLPIGEVAQRWGFATQAHFASCFKAEYGMTPSEHRRGIR